jgi:hypothetical protein
MREYTCEACGGVFETMDDWSDEQALEEYSSAFPDDFDEPRSEVCDDCYDKFMRWREGQ